MGMQAMDAGDQGSGFRTDIEVLELGETVIEQLSRRVVIVSRVRGRAARG